jgi:hypothetical protein
MVTLERALARDPGLARLPTEKLVALVELSDAMASLAAKVAVAERTFAEAIGRGCPL